MTLLSMNGNILFLRKDSSYVFYAFSSSDADLHVRDCVKSYTSDYTVVSRR